jgi:hypothetical protein
MGLVGEDVLDIAFTIRISRGILLGLLADVIIISSLTLKPKLIIGSAVVCISRARGGRLNCKEACVVEPYIHYLANILIY